MPTTIRAPHSRGVHGGDDVVGHIWLIGWGARLVALPGAAIVQDEDAVRVCGVARQGIGLLEPEARGEAEPLDEDHVLSPLADHPVVNPRAPGTDCERHGFFMPGFPAREKRRATARREGDGSSRNDDPDEVHVESVLPGRADFTVGEVDAILEGAYLATAADGVLHHRGARGVSLGGVVLRQIAAGGGSAKAKPIADKDLDALFERFAVRSDHAERAERIKAMRERLGRTPVRELAYKIAFAMLCDLDANDDEAAYDDELIAAFGIDGERADALAAEVYAALDADLDRDSEAPPR